MHGRQDVSASRVEGVKPRAIPSLSCVYLSVCRENGRMVRHRQVDMDSMLACTYVQFCYGTCPYGLIHVSTGPYSVHTSVRMYPAKRRSIQETWMSLWRWAVIRQKRASPRHRSNRPPSNDELPISTTNTHSDSQSSSFIHTKFPPKTAQPDECF